MRPIKLKPRERIVAVVPERCSGPGWLSSPVWVYIEGPSGIRAECLQPDEQSDALLVLHAAGAEMARALISAVPFELVERDVEK